MKAKPYLEGRRNERIALRISTAPIALKLSAALLLAGFCGSSASSASLHLKPGRYTLAITYEVQNQRQDESRNITRCIRPRDLNNPENIFNDRVSTITPEEVCSVKDLKSARGQISYDAECSNRTVHVAGSVNTTGFSVLRTVTPKASRGITLKFAVRGTRIGNCGAESPRTRIHARNSAQRK